MGFGTSDIPAMLADFGVPMVLADAETKCIFETPDQTVWRGDGGGQVLAGVRLATLQRGTLPGLSANATVTIDGVAYKVVNVQAVDDGELIHCFVTRP